MQIRTLKASEARQAVALHLRKIAQRIMTDPDITDVVLNGSRPARELDPLRGECPMDGFRHHTLGPVETWIVTISHEGMLG